MEHRFEKRTHQGFRLSHQQLPPRQILYHSPNKRMKYMFGYFTRYGLISKKYVYNSRELVRPNIIQRFVRNMILHSFSFHYIIGRFVREFEVVDRDFHCNLHDRI